MRLQKEDVREAPETAPISQLSAHGYLLGLAFRLSMPVRIPTHESSVVYRLVRDREHRRVRRSEPRVTIDLRDLRLEASHHLRERRRDVRLELSPRALVDEHQRATRRVGLPVCALDAQRVVHAAHANQLARVVRGPAEKPMRMASAIRSQMVLVRDARGELLAPVARENNARALDRVPLDHGALLHRELDRLE